MENILQKSDITYGKHSAKNIIYGTDLAKIKHHLSKILYKNQTSIEKNSAERNIIYGKDYAKIRQHLWKKVLYKTKHRLWKRYSENKTPYMQKILK